MKFLLFIFTVVLSSCATKNLSLKETPNTSSQPAGDIVILATTDFHSTLDKAEAMAQEINKIRTKYEGKVLHLDGGDLFQGSLEGNLNKGKSIVEFYNAIGVDAAAMGNHELDYGPDVAGRSMVLHDEDGLGNLRRRYREAKFNWLSANFTKIYNEKSEKKCDPEHDLFCNALGEYTFFKPRTIVQRNGNQVCIFGGTTPTTPQITNTLFIRGMKFNQLKETIISEVEFFKKTQKCNFILMTVHAGLNCDKDEHCKEPGDMAEILNVLSQLPHHYLDGIIAGHTHLKAREIINGVPVIEAGSYAKVLGLLHLYKNPTMSPKFEDWTEIPANFKPDAISDKISKILKPYRDQALNLKSRKLGFSKGKFEKTYHSESALGNMIADMLLAEAKKRTPVDFSLTNSGGIRNDFPAGIITYGHVFQVMPFDNSLAVVDLKGSELKKLLEIAYSGGNGIPPSSGLKIKRFDLKPSDHGSYDRDLNNDGKFETWERNIVLEIRDHNGKPLEDESIYRLATIDFLVLGAEHQDTIYKNIPEDRIHKYTGVWIRDMFESFIKKKKVIDPIIYFDSTKPRIELIQYKN